MANVAGPLYFTVLGQKRSYASKEFALGTGILLFFLAFWQYRVLTRPNVRSLFIEQPASKTTR